MRQAFTAAAIQFCSRPLDLDHNLTRATECVAAAHARGAQLVVLPELFNTGYHEHGDLHRLAEDWTGPTVRGLRELSARYGLYLVGGFVERHRVHVYDSLVLCTPTGAVSIYRKRHLIFWEHFYFRPGRHPLIAETPLGRIGFAICADMLYDHVWSEYRGQIDLAVICSAWPGPCASGTRRVSWLLRPSWELAGDIPLAVARELDIPVVFANHCGLCQVRVPMLAGPSAAQFAGRSAIYNGAAGRTTAEFDGEGIAVAPVTIRKESGVCATLSA